jgi:hypothetical protein
MGYTEESIRANLKSQNIEYDETGTYILETHKGSMARLVAGTHEAVTNLPDSTLSDTGTMVLMKEIKVSPPPAPPKVEPPKVQTKATPYSKPSPPAPVERVSTKKPTSRETVGGKKSQKRRF